MPDIQKKILRQIFIEEQFEILQSSFPETKILFLDKHIVGRSRYRGEKDLSLNNIM